MLEFNELLHIILRISALHIAEGSFFQMPECGQRLGGGGPENIGGGNDGGHGIGEGARGSRG